jgi:DNA/RNA-binding domain of Phe-tRNA-synthetase-like protein
MKSGGGMMKKFIIEKEFWEIFPEVQFGIVIAKGIDNTINEGNQDLYAQMLSVATKESVKYLQEGEFSKNPVVAVWREAFQKFKTKKGARASIEALLKRISKGNVLGTINPLVDIYNSLSLTYALPCGGEDINTFEGDLRLTLAKGDEYFITLGSGKNEEPYPDEIIYKDNGGAVCRCWNWREAERTMLTENTRNAFMCIESVDSSRASDLKSAVEALAKSIKEHLGGEVETMILDQAHPMCDLGVE